ncbi:MAG: hypothetical protein ACPGYT_11730 [Nitrospirales bacterium]
MIHEAVSPLAGTTVLIKETSWHPHFPDFGGAKFIVEDWWDRVGGQSWRTANGNPACMIYALRGAQNSENIPKDDEVLYGKIGSMGVLVHVNEIEISPNKKPE